MGVAQAAPPSDDRAGRARSLKNKISIASNQFWFKALLISAEVSQAYDVLMRKISAQSSNRLLLPMGALALIAGVICGLLVVVLMWFSSRDEAVMEPGSVSATGGFWLEYGVFAVYAALIGGGIALFPGLGAYVAVFIQELNNPDASGQRQALWAGWGASIGSLLPALVLLVFYLSDPSDHSILYVAAGFVLLCFALTYVLIYMLLGYLQRRDHRTVKNSLQAQIS